MSLSAVQSYREACPSCCSVSQSGNFHQSHCASSLIQPCTSTYSHLSSLLWCKINTAFSPLVINTTEGSFFVRKDIDALRVYMLRVTLSVLVLQQSFAQAWKAPQVLYCKHNRKILQLTLQKGYGKIYLQIKYRTLIEKTKCRQAQLLHLLAILQFVE